VAAASWKCRPALARASCALAPASQRLHAFGAPEDLEVVVGDVLGRTMAADNPRESSAKQLREIVARCIVGW
jgi:hypothetical protein